MIPAADAKGLVEAVLKQAPEDSQVEAILISTDQQLSRYGDYRIVQNVGRHLLHADLRIQRGNRQAKLNLQKFDEKSIANAYRKLESILSIAPEQSELLPILSEPQDYQSNDAYFDSTAENSPGARAEWIESVIALGKASKVDVAGRYQVDLTTEAYGNTHGLFACNRNSKITLSTTATSENGRGEGWGMTVVNDVKNLNNEKLRDHAIKFANRAANPKSKPAGDYAVILEPAAVAELLSFLSRMAFSGRDFVDARSYVSGKLGEKIFGSNVTIKADPLDRRLPGRPFDFEGVATKPTTLIENGILNGLCWDRKSASRTESVASSNGFSIPQPNTWGPIARNIVMQGDPDKTVGDLIGSMDSGLLVKRFHYCNVVNARELSITGMTRSGVFEINNGEIGDAVKNFRFTVSILDVLSCVEAMSRAFRCDGALFGSEVVAPALKLSSFRMTSTTESEAQ